MADLRRTGVRIREAREKMCRLEAGESGFGESFVGWREVEMDRENGIDLGIALARGEIEGRRECDGAMRCS